nr:ParB/RepB/Spo0J family partition protein [uncultured Rhodopila sp.]
MTKPPSRFGALKQAIEAGTVEATEHTVAEKPAAPIGAGVHRPALALGSMVETMRERISRLENELAHTSSTNHGLVAELERTRALSEKVTDDDDEFVFLQVDAITDRLPRDRLRGGTTGKEFDDLLADIEKNGQNDAITVRRASDGSFEVAAGRRRLEACRRLQRSVLARVRQLDDQAMLRIQFSENERRADVSALERARWFSDVQRQLRIAAKEIASQFGIDPSTFSLYLRLARFPDEILDRLIEPRRLAVVPARRIMEKIENDAEALQRIIDALDAHRQSANQDCSIEDPVAQIDVLMRAAEGREEGRAGKRHPIPERRHIVDRGRRIGTLTRNGGQWVFRFATSIPDNEVQQLAERLAKPITRPDDTVDDVAEIKASTKG